MPNTYKVIARAASTVNTSLRSCAVSSFIAPPLRSICHSGIIAQSWREKMIKPTIVAAVPMVVMPVLQSSTALPISNGLCLSRISQNRRGIAGSTIEANNEGSSTRAEDKGKAREKNQSKRTEIYTVLSLVGGAFAWAYEQYHKSLREEQSSLDPAKNHSLPQLEMITERPAEQEVQPGDENFVLEHLSRVPPVPAFYRVSPPDHDEYYITDFSGKRAWLTTAFDYLQLGDQYLNDQEYYEAWCNFRHAAERGSARAQHQLACLYAYGTGVAGKNLVRAREYFELAAEQGIPQARFNLGLFHQAGVGGVAQNSNAAVKHYLQAAKQGLAEAQVRLGLYFLQQDNRLEASHWFREASSQSRGGKDVAIALFHLGSFYFEGEGGIPKDKVKAFKYWEKSADQGDFVAQNNVGVAYMTGQGGVDIDPAKALKYLKKADAQNYAEAQYNLAVYYATGQHGVGIDEKKELEFLEKAAKQDHPEALCRLGVYYDEGGCGLKPDPVKALECFKKSAALGDPIAQYNAGVYYAKGKGGVDVDLVKACEYWKESADQGYEPAIAALKEAHEAGIGVET